MCVIAICQSSRLTSEQVTRMWNANSHGGGIAFRNGRSRDQVLWHKDVELEEMLSYAERSPLPHVLHFRRASADTDQGPGGCHPFVIDAEATADLRGHTSDYVLFHNGYWSGWQDYIFAQKGPIPDGPWSDTRALALRTHKRGFGFLRILDERVVCFGPKDIRVFGTWKVLPHPDGDILISNNLWERDSVSLRGEILA